MSTTPAVTIGFRHSARVVAAAAIIMISVFAGFAFGGEPELVQVGLALAAAIAFDAFIVRMTIVPAASSRVGDRAWWSTIGSTRCCWMRSSDSLQSSARPLRSAPRCTR